MEPACEAGVSAEGYEFILHEDMPQDENAAGPANRRKSGSVVAGPEQSDEGLKLLGCRLELKWSSGNWYRGTICEYNSTKRKHKVMYDDGDLRWYYLPEMVFRFISEEDEWVKC